MKIIIELDEKYYNDIKEAPTANNYSVLHTLMGVRNSTTLPEFKGRLVSANDLKNIIMLKKSELGILAIPIANFFENIVNEAPTVLSNEWLENGE